MGRRSSSVVSQMVVVGLVVGVVPYATPRPDPNAGSARTILTSTPSTADLEAEERYLALAETGAEAAAEAVTVEEAAIALADSLAAIPASDVDGAASCPTQKLAVSWEKPGAEYVHGAFVEPLGPAPGADTDAVNGVVICEGYPFAFMGFEAARADGSWDVVAVPYIGSEDGHEPANEDADHHHDDEAEDDHAEEPGEAAPRIELPDGDLGPIEGYARYEPQRICHGSAKPGTDALKRLLLGRYPMTRNLGIVRGCSIGGRSEHKEGRAFDWGAYTHRSGEKAAVDDMIARLLATDEAGNRHALARRMGVMYMIWDGKIWSAYRHQTGWRPYSGRSPHTDHVHISLSWDGAMGRTSFWNANGVEAMLAAPAGAVQLATDDGGATSDRRAQRAPEPAPSPSPSPEERDAQRQARRDARREEFAARLAEWIRAHQAEYEAHNEDWTDEQVEEYQRRLAEWNAALEQVAEDEAEAEEARTEWTDEQRAEYEHRLAEWRAAQERERERREERDAARAEERERRREVREQREADRAARRAEHEAEREQRREARQQWEAERRAQQQAERERRHQAREQREAERRAEWEAERERRQQAREQRETERQSHRQERDARREAERERRQQAREEREARRQAERERRQQAREERDARRQAERDERRRRWEEWRRQREGRGETESPTPTETATPTETPTSSSPTEGTPTEGAPTEGSTEG